jgi:hypothetical protein
MRCGPNASQGGVEADVTRGQGAGVRVAGK